MALAASFSLRSSFPTEAKTAADFAHQAAEAAEAARNGLEQNALALTKSIAHSAIAVRPLGIYEVYDVVYGIARCIY